MSSGLDAKVRDILVRKRVVLDLMSLGARPAGFEPATRGLEVLLNAFPDVSGGTRNRLFKANSPALHS